MRNCRTPDLPNSPVQQLIGKSGRLYIRVVVCLFGCLCDTVATVLMLLWPLKMLKLSVGPSVGTDCFCNVLDWTGLDLTGTMVDLPNTMVDLPDTMVDPPETRVDLPDTLVDLPDTMVNLLDTMVKYPD